MTIPAYPLQWPEGWKRTAGVLRKSATFTRQKKQLSVNDGVIRCREELGRMGVSDADLVISTNIALRMDGWPRSDQQQPQDPGVAIYWRIGEAMSCMAVDRYDRVADNLAAIAATLDAMRAIERHGGAEILNRAFKGFTAIEHDPKPHWSDILGVDRNSSTTEARSAWRVLRSQYHPDKPTGDVDMFRKVNQAYSDACAEHGVQE